MSKTSRPSKKLTNRTPYAKPKGNLTIVKKPTISRQNAILTASLVTPERKNLDMLNQTLTTNTFKLLNDGITQGTGSSQRIGRKIKMCSFDIRWRLSMDGTTGCAALVRVKIIYDKQPNGALPASGDVFAGTPLISFNNLSNSERFVTLYDQYLPPLQTDGPRIIGGQIFKNINLDTMFLSATTTGAIGDITTGSLLIGYTDALVGADPKSTLFFYGSRVRYYDA